MTVLSSINLVDASFGTGWKLRVSRKIFIEVFMKVSREISQNLYKSSLSKVLEHFYKTLQNFS